MPELSKNARVLKYLSQRARRPLSKTQAQKLPYFADLIARKYLGRPITGFDWVWHHYGPYDPHVDDAVRELEESGLAKWRHGFFNTGLGGSLLIDSETVADLALTPVERHILDLVCKEYDRLETRELLDRAYATEPMIEVQEHHSRGVRLPMEMVDGAEMDSLGYNLEEVLHEAEKVEQGEYVLANDLFDALRAKSLREDSEANR